MRLDHPIWLPSRKLLMPNFPPGFGFSTPAGGLSAAQAAAVNGILSSGPFASPPNRTWGALVTTGAGGIPSIYGDPDLVSGGSYSGTVSAINDATGTWRRITADQASGAGFIGCRNTTTNATKKNQLPYVDWIWRSGPDITASQMAVGFVSANTIPTYQIDGSIQAGAVGLDAIGVRFATGAPFTQLSPQWQFFVSIAGTIGITVGATIGPNVTASTTYRVRVQLNAGNTVTITVNGVSATISLAAFAFAAGTQWGSLWQVQSNVNTKILDHAIMFISRQVIVALPA